SAAVIKLSGEGRPREPAPLLPGPSGPACWKIPGGGIYFSPSMYTKSKYVYLKERRDIGMYIDQEACVGCGLCVPYCPVGAISVSGRKAVIDADACVECSCCRRSRVCRKDAICQEELKMPRAVRSVM